METAPTSIFSERPIATAIAIGIATLIPHLFLSPALSLALAAIVMGMVAGVYFGFAVVRGNNFQQQIEFNVTLLFLVAALLGVWVSPWFIPAAFLAHGLWDFAHHNSVNSRLVSIPQWYIPWCVVIDVILGVGLIVVVALERGALEKSRVSTRQGVFMRLSLVVVGLLLIVPVAPALALPAPMSDQELTDKSDLVATVRVLSVSCTVVTKDDKTGEELPVYLAKLRLLEVKKGDAKKGDEILVTWRAIPKDVVGPWTVNYYPGEVVQTHLVKKSGGVSYGSTWWNAKGEDIKAPENTELPTTPGETFDAPKDSTDQHPL